MSSSIISLFLIGGLIFTVGPVLAFFAFSIFMIREIAKDDEGVQGLLKVLSLLFVVGIILLAISYFG